MRFRFLVSWFAFCKALKRCSFLFEIRIIEPMISILTTTWIKNAVIGIEPMTYRLWACRANHCAIQQGRGNWIRTNDLQVMSLSR